MKKPGDYALAALVNWRNDAETKISQGGVMVIATEAALRASRDAIEEAAGLAESVDAFDLARAIRELTISDEIGGD
jgi:hypothetical protein